MANKIEIENVELAELTAEQALTHVETGFFDDNGGEPDGNLYLCEEGDLIRTDGVKFVRGFKIEAYSENAGYVDFCGWSSRDLAYTTDQTTAAAIVNDEAGIRGLNV